MQKCFHAIWWQLYFNSRIATLEGHIHFIFYIFIVSWFSLAPEQKEMPKPSQKQNMSCLLANCTSKKSLTEEGNDTGKAMLLIFFIERTEAEWSQLIWRKKEKQNPRSVKFLCTTYITGISPSLFKYNKPPTHAHIYSYTVPMQKPDIHMHMHAHTFVIHAKIWIL